MGSIQYYICIFRAIFIAVLTSFWVHLFDLPKYYWVVIMIVMIYAEVLQINHRLKE